MAMLKILFILLFSVTVHAQTINNGTIQIGVNINCGGTIQEFSMIGGVNLVNNFDCTGRQIQAALYDGSEVYDSCAGCTDIWGWNPVQGGDRWNQGSIVIDQLITPTNIYIKTQPYEWSKGAELGFPVLSDVYIEQWIEFVSIDPRAVKVHYKITHFGMDNHTLANQEFPAVYVNGEYNRLLPPNITSVAPNTAYSTPEKWQAYVNSFDDGLTVHAPGQYPWVFGFQGIFDPFNYLTPFTPFAFGPNMVMEGDIYLFAGNYNLARQTINNLPLTADFTPPYGHLDSPVIGQILRGNVTISGWSFDNMEISRIEILVDGKKVGQAIYNKFRPDIPAVYPGASSNTGYSYTLDTRKYRDGNYTISVRAVDISGQTSILRTPVNVTFKNNRRR